MKKLLLLLATSVFAMAQTQTDAYQYTLDLNAIENDQFKVSVILPKQKDKTVVFSLPKMVPGTYSEDNYGRYIENLEAFDKTGKKLKVAKKGQNAFTITKAKKLYKITYKVNDTFDDAMGEKPIFEPAGTNIELDKNYLLNNHGVFGYLKGQEKKQFEVSVKHAESFYGSTAMVDADPSNTKDVFNAASYNYLVDNPIMYCRPDTATVIVGGAKVLISVYTPHKTVSAKFLAEKASPLLNAQAKYLGGKLPITNYAFIVYMTDQYGLSGSVGALEHSNGSLYYFNEMSQEDFGPTFTDVAAHEFFHILTPLNMHSEQIHYFDFDEPKMSRHLWLYEGTTEYHSHAVQVQNGLKNPADFLKEMENKIATSKAQFDDALPFTKLSLGALKEHEPQYGNVYQKGALIGMCLDLIMRKNTKGAKGLIDLELELSKKYGPDKPFIDAELFKEIRALSNPEVLSFLEKHVDDGQPLPLKELLGYAGVLLEESKKVRTFNMGNVGLNLNPEGQISVVDISKANQMGKNIGYVVGDVIKAINGQEVNLQNYAAVRKNWMETVKEGDTISITLVRKNADGAKVEVIGTSMVDGYTTTKTNVLSYLENPSADQMAIRNAWLGL